VYKARALWPPRLVGVHELHRNHRPAQSDLDVGNVLDRRVLQGVAHEACRQGAEAVEHAPEVGQSGAWRARRGILGILGILGSSRGGTGQ
jgi:hypothetical protein